MSLVGRVVDFLRDLLVGALCLLFRGHAKLLLLGLDNAGKTTLLSMLAEDSICSSKPTKHPRCKKLIIGNTECDIFDLKGHRRARRQWKDHISRVRGIVFVVDATDRERLPEARAEIDALLAVKRLKKVPILVLGNKVDLSGHVSEEELRQALGLFKSPYVTFEPGAIEVFMCSAAMKRGYGRGINWLLKQIQGIPC